MDRTERLSDQLQSLETEIRNWWLPLIPSGWSLLIIASIDMLQPADPSALPGVMVTRDHRLADKLDELHLQLKAKLDRWAQEAHLVNGAEEVCVTCLLVPSQRLPTVPRISGINCTLLIPSSNS